MTFRESVLFFKAYVDRFAASSPLFLKDLKKLGYRYGTIMHRFASQAFVKALQQELETRHQLYKAKVNAMVSFSFSKENKVAMIEKRHKEEIQALRLAYGQETKASLLE